MTRARSGIRLDGGKIFCSGAGHATRALVTATDDGGIHICLCSPLARASARAGWRRLCRACALRSTARSTLPAARWILTPVWASPATIYVEPAFSTGAWRGSRCSLRVAKPCRDHADQLKAADRIGNPAISWQRLGNAMIWVQTSSLWVWRAARIAEDPTVDPAKAVAYVGLARIAVEMACLDAMQLVRTFAGTVGIPAWKSCRTDFVEILGIIFASLRRMQC